MRVSSFSFSLLFILISVYHHPPRHSPYTALVALRPTPTKVPPRRTPAQFFPLLLPSNTHPLDYQRARTFGHVPSILLFLSVFRIFFFCSHPAAPFFFSPWNTNHLFPEPPSKLFDSRQPVADIPIPGRRRRSR